jgi:hypothetical protein
MRDICARKHGGVSTSRDAFAGTPQEIRLEQSRMIYKLVRSSSTGPGWGVTCEEASDTLKMRYTTASARISELLADGFIEDTGLRRPTRSGASARVLAPATSGGRSRKTLRGFRREKVSYCGDKRWKTVRAKSSVKRYVCHGCGRPFKPMARGNTRCAWCRRTSHVMEHQRRRLQARKGSRGAAWNRRYRNHSCEDCRWALRRGFTMEKP